MPIEDLVIVVVIAVTAVDEDTKGRTVIVDASQMIRRAVDVEREQIRIEDAVAVELFAKPNLTGLGVDVQQLVHKLGRFMDVDSIVPLRAQFIHRRIKNDCVGGRRLIDND